MANASKKRANRALSAETDDWEDVPAANPVVQQNAGPQVDPGDWLDVPNEGNTPKPATFRDKAQAAYAGAAQSTLRGYAPRIVGKMAEYWDKNIAEPVINPKTGERIPRTDYKTARDATTQDIARTEEKAPGYFLAGNVAASLADPLNRRMGGGGMLKSVLTAGAEGALYNPGDKPGTEGGSLNPLEGDGWQLGDRALGGTLAATFGGAAHMGANAVGAGARAFLAKRAMNRPGFSRSVQEQIQNAADNVYNNYVAPRAKTASEALKDKVISFRPDILSRTAPDESSQGLKILRNRLRKRAAGPEGNFEVDLQGDKANRLRQVLDQRADYSQKNSLGNATVGKMGERQKSAADVLRAKIKKAAPELSDNFDEQSAALGLTGEVLDKSQNPQALLTGQYFGDMGSKLLDFDSIAGSNLRGLGQDIARGRWLQGKPGTSLVPEYLMAPVRFGANLGAGVSVPLAPLMNKGLSQATMKAILEEIMSGKTLPEGGQ